jgi:hypothetical protein
MARGSNPTFIVFLRRGVDFLQPATWSLRCAPCALSLSRFPLQAPNPGRKMI